MKHTFRPAVVMVLALWAAAAVPAEEGRYELGRRLRALEIMLATQHAPEALDRANPYLNDAVRDFFAGRWSEAAAGLDLARFSLASAERPSQPVRWAASLSVTPTTFALDAASDELGFAIAPFYKVSGNPPTIKVEIALRSAAHPDAGGIKFTLDTPTHKDVLPLRIHEEDDYTMVVDALVEGQRLNIAHHKISLVQQLRPRLQRLRDGLRALPPVARNTQRATLEEYVSALSTLVHGGQLETSVRAAYLLREAEGLLTAETKKQSYFGQGRAGDFWLTLAAPTGTVRVRLMAPEAAAKREPLPLVIALHGAGGSENMFFDAYGAGKTVDLCQKRGWLLVAPAATFFGLGLSPQKVIDEIAKLYPVDSTRALTVGHSMGAAHAVRVAELLTEPPVAVAALGGGGRLRQSERLRNTAFFIGVGSEDFLIDQAKLLDRSLRDAGVPEVQYKEYPHVEHIGIVQLALDDVFEFFDKQMKAADK